MTQSAVTAAPLAEQSNARNLSEALRAAADLRDRSAWRTPNTEPSRFLAATEATGPGIDAIAEVFHAGAAVMLARISRIRVPVRIGYARLPTPRLRVLDVVYGGLLHDHSPDSIASLTQAITNHLASGVDLVRINHLRDDDPVSEPIRAMGIPVRSEPHYALSFPNARNGQDALSHRSSKSRSKLRRYAKKLDETVGDTTLEVYTRPDDVDLILRATEQITSRTYHAAIGYGVRDTPRWRTLLTRAANSGHMRTYILSVHGKPIAYQNGLLIAGAYHLDGKGYDPDLAEHRPGNTLFLRMLDDLVANGCHTIDFGFGEAEYKQVFAKESWNETTYHIYGKSARARAQRVLEAIAGNTHAFATRHAGIASRMKRGWRRKLTDTTPKPSEDTAP